MGKKKYIISKVKNFVSWEGINKLEDFTYPWRKDTAPKTTFAAYYDNEYIYFRFVAFCSKPKVFVNNNNKMEVTNSERVEIFFRSNEKMKPYYCLEVDPNGRVLDYRANLYREFDRGWKWPDSLAINTNITNESYSVEGKISFSALKKLKLIEDNKIEIGLYRGYCADLNKDKAFINWISWVNSKTEKPDFHVPSSFGLLYLKPN